MRLAYSISGYKDPDQFAWLFGAIADARDSFIIHIDANSPAAIHDGFRAITDPHAQAHGNVHYIEPEPIVWMGQGLVRAEFRAIAKLFQAAPNFDYLISLSAQDYPLTTRQARVDLLHAQPSANHIAMRPLDALPFHIRRRRFLYSFEWRGKLIKTPLPRLIPDNIEIAWKGSWWRVLSRPFCAWLMTTAMREPYMRFLRHVQAPDELVMQNLIKASPYAGTVTGDNQHLVVWPGNSGSPHTLTLRDWPLLTASPKLFARKFDHRIDAEVLARLAARIGAPVPAGRQAGGHAVAPAGNTGPDAASDSRQDNADDKNNEPMTRVHA